MILKEEKHINGCLGSSKTLKFSIKWNRHFPILNLKTLRYGKKTYLNPYKGLSKEWICLTWQNIKE